MDEFTKAVQDSRVAIKKAEEEELAKEEAARMDEGWWTPSGSEHSQGIAAA